MKPTPKEDPITVHGNKVFRLYANPGEVETFLTSLAKDEGNDKVAASHRRCRSEKIVRFDVGETREDLPGGAAMGATRYHRTHSVGCTGSFKRKYQVERTKKSKGMAHEVGEGKVQTKKSPRVRPLPLQAYFV